MSKRIIFFHAVVMIIAILVWALLIKDSLSVFLFMTAYFWHMALVSETIQSKHHSKKFGISFMKLIIFLYLTLIEKVREASFYSELRPYMKDLVDSLTRAVFPFIFGVGVVFVTREALYVTPMLLGSAVFEGVIWVYYHKLKESV